jgi:hypothetical protein
VFSSVESTVRASRVCASTAEEPPAGTCPIRQVRVEPAAEQKRRSSFRKLTPRGRLSVTTASKTSDGPVLVTMKRQVRVPPATG